MLQDQYRESSKIENEYGKLLQAWDHELSSNPTTDIKKLKINRSEHIQFTLMHLFSGYLDQIWTDSQNMLRCAQAWSSQNTETLPSDAIYTMNILSLHLMKQSLLTRQEFFRIVDELNGVSFETESHFSASDSTISEEFTISHPAFYNHGYVDLEKETLKTDRDFHRDAYNMECYEPFLAKDKNEVNSAPDSIKPNKFVTPVKSSDSKFKSVIDTDMPKVPLYTRRYNNEVHNVHNEQDNHDHKMPSHFRQDPLLLKKRSSSISVQSMKYNVIQSTDDEYDKQEDIKSFGIASYYYNSESDDDGDIVEREFLIERPIVPIGETNTAGGRMKTAIKVNSCNSSSSSIMHYDVKTKQIKSNKSGKSKQTVHQRHDSSSTCLPRSICSSLYSGNRELDSNNAVEELVCNTSEKKTDPKSIYSLRMKIASLFKKISGKESSPKGKNDENMLNFPAKSFRKVLLHKSVS
ncbi:unnamed protein product [Mucor hiemalis]